MKLMINLVTTAILTFNLIAPCTKEEPHPRIIDAFILAYDAMYKAPDNFNKDYIILDMDSSDFAETTYEDRKKMMEYFKKYNKTVLNASIFRLKEIGLADSYGSLKINGLLLMFKCIKPNNSSGIIIEGIKYVSPTAANLYDIYLEVENNKWVLKSIKSTGVA